MQTTFESKPAVARAEGATIRPFGRADAQPVADLLVRVFQHADRPAPRSMAEYLQKVFLDAPHCDPEISSRVLQRADGTVAGFIGVVALPMILDGRRIRAAIATSLAVDDRAADPLAGARLMRSFLGGPQDISLADRANETSTAMWTSQRGSIMRDYSLEWQRILRPAGHAVDLLAGRIAAARLAAPIARLVDDFASRWLRRSSGRGRPTKRDAAAVADVEPDALLDLVPKFWQRHDLRPDWSREALAGILADAAQKSDYGPLTSRLVSRAGQDVGLFLYHLKRGGIARVLQVMALPGHEDAVIGRLIADVAAADAVAVRGRVQPWAIDPLLARHCVLFTESLALVHSRDRQLLAHFDAGTAFFNGLAGEYWLRLNGDRFA